MQIYLWRHGKAEAAAHSQGDPDRRLTPEGKDQLVRIGKYMNNQMHPVGRIFTSPYIRALQTAYILQIMMEYDGDINIIPELACGANPETILRILEPVAETTNSIAIVGHMPDLTKIASYLLDSGEEVLFQPGSMLKLTLPRLAPRQAKKELYLSPEDV